MVKMLIASGDTFVDDLFCCLRAATQMQGIGMILGISVYCFSALETGGEVIMVLARISPYIYERSAGDSRSLFLLVEAEYDKTGNCAWILDVQPSLAVIHNDLRFSVNAKCGKICWRRTISKRFIFCRPIPRLIRGLEGVSIARPISRLLGRTRCLSLHMFIRK